MLPQRNRVGEDGNVLLLVAAVLVLLSVLVAVAIL
jgi:hypothetical protein